MKWDIDKEIEKYEPEVAPGTTFSRAYLDLAYMEKEGLTPTPKQRERGGANVWCLAVGYLSMPKAFFYGRTMREAFLRMRKAAKAQTLADHTPWGRQEFQPSVKKGRDKGSKNARS